jgi:hypothetical protein
MKQRGRLAAASVGLCLALGVAGAVPVGAAPGDQEEPSQADSGTIAEDQPWLAPATEQPEDSPSGPNQDPLAESGAWVNDLVYSDHWEVMVPLGPVAAELDQLSTEIERLAGLTDDEGEPLDEWEPGHPRQVEGYLLDVVADGKLHLFWKGPLPPEVQAALDAHPLARVIVHDMPYDEDELHLAQHVIGDHLTDPPGDTRLEAVLPNGDYSGLWVVLFGSLDGDQIAALESQLSTWTDIPASVRVIDHPLWNLALARATVQ